MEQSGDHYLTPSMHFCPTALAGMICKFLNYSLVINKYIYMYIYEVDENKWIVEKMAGTPTQRTKSANICSNISFISSFGGSDGGQKDNKYINMVYNVYTVVINQPAVWNGLNVKLRWT